MNFRKAFKVLPELAHGVEHSLETVEQVEVLDSFAVEVDCRRVDGRSMSHRARLALGSGACACPLATLP